MTAERVADLLGNHLKTSTDRNVASDADFVIEVILENMELKKELLRELDTICPAHAIFASNTALCRSPRWLLPSRIAPISSSAATS